MMAENIIAWSGVVCVYEVIHDMQTERYVESVSELILGSSISDCFKIVSGDSC